MAVCVLDHPRSRGVYFILNETFGAGAGSSPLARGLPFTRPPRNSSTRIIPARAGFTPDAPTAPTSPTDHPRSRGVYLAVTVGTATIAGSSPLARGLRRLLRPPRMRRRIIPARAGFTLGDFPPLLSPGDHPRSRGVYAPAVVSMLIRVGSSPLARGLPIIQRRAIADGGIIPARAGFTLVEGGSVYDVKDHPRSRGVYYFVRLPRSSEIGSSPLARGLRRNHESSESPGRIIPARAGFTG